MTAGVWECPHRGPEWCGATRVVTAEVVVPLAGAYVQQGTAGEHLASPATAMLGSPGDEYRVRHPAGGRDRCLVFLIEEPSLEDLARATGALEGAAPRFAHASIPLAPSALLEAHRLGSDLESGALDPAEGGFRIAEILGRVLGAAPVKRTRASAGERTERIRRKAVLRALEYMASSFGARTTLADIAAAAGYSPFHFSRVFRAVTGSTVHERLTDFRLRSALHRIHDGADDLTAVALASGFSSHSHFGAAFRDRFGLPPSAARAELPRQRWPSTGRGG